MSKTRIVATIMLLTATSPLFAAEWVYTGSADGQGWFRQGPEYRNVAGKRERVDPLNNAGVASAGTATSRDQNWAYAGSADGQGWSMRSHEYGFDGGRIVHLDNRPHDTPKPSTQISEEERKRNFARAAR